MDFGAKIRFARERLGLSQEQVAKLVPMNQSNYSKIERNLQEPSMLQLKRLCSILDVTPEFLLDIVAPPPINYHELVEDLRLLTQKYGIR